jgi:hypothetical protein
MPKRERSPESSSPQATPPSIAKKERAEMSTPSGPKEKKAKILTEVAPLPHSPLLQEAERLRSRNAYLESELKRLKLKSKEQKDAVKYLGDNASKLYDRNIQSEEKIELLEAKVETLAALAKVLWRVAALENNGEGEFFSFFKKTPLLMWRNQI